MCTEISQKFIEIPTAETAQFNPLLQSLFYPSIAHSVSGYVYTSGQLQLTRSRTSLQVLAKIENNLGQ